MRTRGGGGESWPRRVAQGGRVRLWSMVIRGEREREGGGRHPAKGRVGEGEKEANEQ